MTSIKKISVERNLQVISFVVLFFLVSCSPRSSRVDFSGYPNSLKNILANNEKIPSFSASLSLYNQSPTINFSADGQIFFDQSQKRIKLILRDTLTEQVIMDLVVGKTDVWLYLSEEVLKKQKGKKPKGRVFREKRQNFHLNQYIRDWKIDLETLVQILGGKIFILPQATEIQLESVQTNETKKSVSQILFYRLKKNKPFKFFL